nr:hypothetical protein [uncultured Acetobacterium sp.]
MLNSAQVKELFGKEAFLIGNNDGVLIEIAQKLFGKKAVTYARMVDKGGHWWNVYGIDKYYVEYLTFEGFKSAAVYANIQEIRENQQKEGDLILLKKPKVNEKRKNNYETKTENDMGLS